MLKSRLLTLSLVLLVASAVAFGADPQLEKLSSHLLRYQPPSRAF